MTDTDPRGEAEAFLAAHPDIRTVDLLLPDLNGILRGKRLAAAEALKLFSGGISVPATAQLLDSRGGLTPGLPYGLEDGDPDESCRAVPGSLVAVPWASLPLAQCLTVLSRRDGGPLPGDSRSVLSAVVAHFAPLGLTPVVAVEYEFYLLEASGQPARPHRFDAPGTGIAAAGPRVYSLEDLDALAPFFADLDSACAVQGLPATGVVSEYGRSQYELNLAHVADVLVAADHALLLRRLVRGVARRHGHAATFMARPFGSLDGSGMHVHMSLLDERGCNVFAPAPGGGPGPALRHAIGGLLAAMPESMAIFAPNANSFRRFRRGAFAPLSASWGANHRHVALRLPVAEAEDTRFEHRVAGADCNPYLALAAILAGVLHGLRHRLEPAPAVAEGQAHDPRDDTPLPLRWNLALDAFEAGGILPEYLGAGFCRLYARARRQEERAYHDAVPELDHAWYLPAI